MIRVWRSAGLTVAVTALVLGVGAVQAAAQGVQVVPWTDRVFVSINGGAQTTAHKTEVRGSFPLYGEVATFDSEVGVEQSSMFDIMGGYRFWQHLAVGVGYSSYSTTSSATVEASIPDPLFFDRLHADSSTVGGLGHSEDAVYLSFYWLMPMTNRVEIGVFTGPTFFSLSKDLPANVNVQTGETTISSTTTSSISESGVGGHFGVDLRYRIASDLGALRSIAAGVMARYAAGSVTANVQGGQIDVGGFQIGVGLRFGF